MEFKEYLNIILLFSAAFAVLMSIYLWFYPYKSFSNRVLGFLMFCWSFTVIRFALQSPEFNLRFPHFYGVTSIVPFLFFPLVFMYVKSYLDRDARRTKGYLIHFIPSVVYLVAMIPFFVQSGEEKIALFQGKNPELEWVYKVSSIGDIIVILQGIVYTILSINLLHHFQYFTDNRLSRNQLISLKWLWQFVVTNVVLWAIGSTGAFLGVMNIKIPFDPFYIFFLGVTFITLRTGYFSVRYPTFFILHPEKVVNSEEVKVLEKESQKSKEEITIILDYMQESKPYLDTDFNLGIFADKVGIPKHRVSELINSEMKKSFSDFVNEYRVQEVVRLIEDGMHIESTLIYIGQEAGFNSKANFFRIFKKVMGMTPNEFIKAREGS